MSVAILWIVALAFLRIDFPIPLLSHDVAHCSPAASSAGGSAYAGGGRAVDRRHRRDADGDCAAARPWARRHRRWGASGGTHFSTELFREERIEDAASEHAQLADAAAWEACVSQDAGGCRLPSASQANFRPASEPRHRRFLKRDGTQLYFSADYGPGVARPRHGHRAGARTHARSDPPAHPRQRPRHADRRRARSIWPTNTMPSTSRCEPLRPPAR